MAEESEEKSYLSLGLQSDPEVTFRDPFSDDIDSLSTITSLSESQEEVKRLEGILLIRNKAEADRNFERKKNECAKLKKEQELKESTITDLQERNVVLGIQSKTFQQDFERERDEKHEKVRQLEEVIASQVEEIRNMKQDFKRERDEKHEKLRQLDEVIASQLEEITNMKLDFEREKVKMHEKVRQSEEVIATQLEEIRNMKERLDHVDETPSSNLESMRQHNTDDVNLPNSVQDPTRKLGNIHEVIGRMDLNPDYAAPNQLQSSPGQEQMTNYTLPYRPHPPLKHPAQQGPPPQRQLHGPYHTEFGWECPHCTYRNEPTQRGCQMCVTGRPKEHQTDRLLLQQQHQARDNRENPQHLPIPEGYSHHNAQDLRERLRLAGLDDDTIMAILVAEQVIPANISLRAERRVRATADSESDSEDETLLKAKLV